MKNTFNVLFYTGISIMVSIVLIIGLFAMNLQNIFKTFGRNQPKVESYVKDTSAYVIQPVEKQTAPIHTHQPKAKQQPLQIKNEIRTKDSNQTEVISNSEEPKDSNEIKILEELL